jgi:aspartyl protease family protein
MRFYVLLGILGIGLALLIVNHDGGSTLGLANDDFGRLVTLSALVAMIGSGILVGRRQFGDTLRQAGIWLLLILALVAVYLYRYDLQSFASRMTAGLVPGRAVVTTAADGAQILVINKGAGGHFEANVAVDGTSVRMLVDTGASSVVLSREDAVRVGIDPAGLTYSITVSTANGRALAAPVTLRELAIGPIVRRNVRAMVTDEGRLDQSLLGMTFLGTLGSLEITRDELRLKD